MEQSSYDVLKKKYSLTDFNVLDAEFEISSVEGDSWILKNVCKKIRERLELVIDVFERILQPDTNSYANMYECKFFTGSEKDAILSLFKHIMHSYRELLELELLNDEKSYAQFIKEFFAEWLQIKKSLLPFVGKLKLAWKESEKEREKLEYLG
ncbi:hypothetical protein HY484_00960 [Candidatus Woesearchaeota archaeon]|nr:hypothetical protein [Candidatus Woesearchaeota archaeon]